MQKLAEICVKRPVFATMIVMALVVVGVFSYGSLGVDLFPKIDLPTITVTTINRGASPREIETEITEKVEEAVNTISGIDEIRSISVEGVSQVFHPSLDTSSLVQRQMRGTGSVMAFEVRGGFEAARQLMAKVRLMTPAVSLGSVDTLIQHPAALTHRPVQSEAKPSDALVRLSIGLEAPEDLIADLSQAFAGSDARMTEAVAAH